MWPRAPSAPRPRCGSPPICVAAYLMGELAPGRRLKIDEIAAICAVSHMPVRGALHELEREGILELSPHRGAVIRPVDAHFVRNTYDLRAAIEGMLTERCAESIDEAGIAELRGKVDGIRRGERRRPTRWRWFVPIANCTTASIVTPTTPTPCGYWGRGGCSSRHCACGSASDRGGPTPSWRSIGRSSGRSSGTTSRRRGGLARAHCVRARDDLLARL